MNIRCWVPGVLIIKVLVLLGAAVPAAQAASAASKNRQGNQLFAKGKYPDAEQAYLSAQLDSPGRPELLYNLGNALLRQKKYDQAVQSLRQAISRGDRGLQAGSWYNLGNTYFEAANFPEAAQAYVQALRINPADRDAKHNLELALRKIQQQKQSASGDNRKDKQQSEQSTQERQQEQQEPEKKPNRGKQPDAQEQQDSKQLEQPQPAQADRREGSFTKDRALQILDAMKNQEFTEQRKLLERQARRKATGKDW